MSPIKRIESESAKTSGDKTRRHTDVKVEQQDILAKQQEIDSAIDADGFSAGVKQFKLERLVLRRSGWNSECSRSWSFWTANSAFWTGNWA
jgi:hypothetical protein